MFLKLNLPFNGDNGVVVAVGVGLPAVAVAVAVAGVIVVGVEPEDEIELSPSLSFFSLASLRLTRRASSRSTRSRH